MFVCTRHAQDEANQTPSLHGGGAHEAPSVAEKVLVVDDNSWRGSHSFFVGVTTGALWLSLWMMPLHAHTVSTSLSQGIYSYICA